MIEYVQSHNPDDRVIKKASDLLRSGKLICFPTDTNWVIACDPYCKSAVESLHKIKQEPLTKHFSLLCSTVSMATEIASIDDHMFRLLKKVIPGSYTFIFMAKKKMIKSVKASKTDHEVGVRFSPSEITCRLIEGFSGPLMSTNITFEMIKLDPESGIDIYSYLIDEVLGHLLSIIIDPGEFEFSGESTIIDMRESSNIQVIREGEGDISLFE